MEVSEKIRKLDNILFFDKENISEIKDNIKTKIDDIFYSINSQNENKDKNEKLKTDINPNDYETNNKNIKILILPNSKYNYIDVNLARAFANLKQSKNFNKIKRVFLIAHPFRSRANKIYLSSYDSYETIFKKNFEIDKEMYEDLKDDPQNLFKKHILHHQINSYNVTSFEEVNINNKINIIENIQTVTESEEDYDFSFDLHLNFLSIIFEQENIKIVPIWFKTNIRDPKDKLIGFLNNFFIKHLNNEENILICSSNFTYFGRNYNYFGTNKDYKNRSFLRIKENEPKILSHIESLDKKAIDHMIKFEENEFVKITNFNFSKDLFLLIIKICIKLGYKINFKNHLCLKFDSKDQIDYELNFCTAGNFLGLTE